MLIFSWCDVIISISFSGLPRSSTYFRSGKKPWTRQLFSNRRLLLEKWSQSSTNSRWIEPSICFNFSRHWLWKYYYYIVEIFSPSRPVCFGLFYNFFSPSARNCRHGSCSDGKFDTQDSINRQSNSQGNVSVMGNVSIIRCLCISCLHFVPSRVKIYIFCQQKNLPRASWTCDSCVQKTS